MLETRNNITIPRKSNKVPFIQAENVSNKRHDMNQKTFNNIKDIRNRNININFPFFMIYSGWSLTIFMDAIWWQQHLHNSQSARSRNGNPRVSQLALVVLLITSAGRLHPGRGRRGRRRPPTVIATPTPTRPLKPGGSTPQFTGVNRTRYLRRSSWVLSSIRILPSGKKQAKDVIIFSNWP